MFYDLVVLGGVWDVEFLVSCEVWWWCCCFMNYILRIRVRGEFGDRNICRVGGYES